MSRFEKESLTKLFTAVLCLESIEECYSFFEDACTIQELEAIAQRFEVAHLLSKGKSYSEVNKLTGASTATICRVGKSFNYGNGGYQMVIDRIESEDTNND